MILSSKQKGVFSKIVFSVLISIVLISSGIIFNPFDYTDGLASFDRFAVVAKSGLLIAFCVATSILVMARRRFLSPKDIDGSGLTDGSEKAKILQSLVQNTLEQSVLAILVYMAWVFMMPALWLSVVPMAAVIFVVGRILFAVGYSAGAPSRALGFTLTFFPTIGMLICIAARELWLQIS